MGMILVQIYDSQSIFQLTLFMLNQEFLKPPTDDSISNPLLKSYNFLFGFQMPQNVFQRLLSGNVPFDLFLLLDQTLNARIFVLQKFDEFFLLGLYLLVLFFKFFHLSLKLQRDFCTFHFDFHFF